VYAFACVADPTGANCMIKVNGTSTDAVTNACQNSGTSCAGACHDAIAAFANSLGCCLDTWFDFMTYVCSIDPTNGICPALPISILKTFITDTCLVPIGPGCGQQYQLGLELIAENLAWIWCFNNQATCESLIKDAIAYQLAIARDDLDAAGVTVTMKQNTSPTRRLLTDTSTTSVSVSGISTKNGVGWITSTSGSVFGVPYDARVATDSQVTLTTTSSDVTDTSPASAVTPSVVAVFLALAVFFL